LLFLNPDARLEAGALRALAAKLGADPRLGAVAPELAYPDGRLQFAWSPDRSVLGELVQKLRNRFEGALWNHRALPAVWRALVGPGWYSAACLLVRRTAFEEVGGFDEGYFLYFEDADLCVRLRRAGWRLAQERAARAVHLCGASSGAGPTRAAYRDSQLRFYKAHRPRWEQRLVTRRAARRRQR
jgi:GT2 family glycosyltransferase